MKYDSDPHKKSVSFSSTQKRIRLDSSYAQNLISVSGAESLESFALPTYQEGSRER